MADKKKKSAQLQRSQKKWLDTLDYKFLIIVAVIAIGIYANSLVNDFVYDDEYVVLKDPSITSLGNVPEFFTRHLGFAVGRFYRPVVSATYALNYALSGAKPFGFHLANVLFHALNSVLVYILLLMMFSNGQNEYKKYFALFGAGLFAIHPIHTEAVAWVSGRTDSVFFTFYILAFIFYLRYTSGAKGRNLLWTSVFYSLSLLSKEMAITFPAVVVLYEVIIMGRRSVYNILKEKPVYLILAAISLFYLLLRWEVLKETPVREVYNYFYGKDAATIFFTMLQALPYYFRMIVLPYGMLYHYGGYMPYLNSVAQPEAIVSLIITLLLIAGAALTVKRAPWISFSMFFVFITLLPVLNIVQTDNFMADRFLYLPSLALSFAAVWALNKYFTQKRKFMFYSAAAVLFIAYGYLTVVRNFEWKTNDTLYQSAEGRPGTIVDVDLGIMYSNRQDFDKASGYYRKALALRSETMLANTGMGKIFMAKGNYDSAYYYIHRAYTLDTLSADAVYSMGLLSLRQNKTDEAIKWMEKLQPLSPNYMNSRQMLAELMKSRQSNNGAGLQSQINTLEAESQNAFKQKYYDLAVADLNKLIKMNPANAFTYYNNMGMCYLDQQKYDEAAKSFEECTKAGKDFTTGWDNLGLAYQKMGQNDKARENYYKALEKDPNNTDAKKHLDEIGR